MTDFDFCDSPGLEDRASGDRTNGFVMCYADQLRVIAALIKEKTLRPRDSSVLIALLSFYNPRTGLCHVTIKHVADVIGGNVTDVSGSVSRLRKNLIVATYIDKVTGQRSLFLNPFMFVSGGASKRAFLQKRFMQLFNE